LVSVSQNPQSRPLRDLCIRRWSSGSGPVGWVSGHGEGVEMLVWDDWEVVVRLARGQAVGGAGQVPAGERQEHPSGVADEAHVAQPRQTVGSLQRPEDAL